LTLIPTYSCKNTSNLPTVSATELDIRLAPMMNSTSPLCVPTAYGLALAAVGGKL